MAPNIPKLPNIPKIAAAANRTGAGSSVGGAIGGVKIPKTVNPKNLFAPPRTPKATTTHTSSDSFLLPLPYASDTINQTAQSGYAADAALAKQNAALGYLTPDQQTARAAQQGAAVQSLYSNLANQIAGIQHVSVNQTNAGTAALGQQNAAAGVTGNPVASATGVANPGVTGNVGAQAVLASQGAGQGNYLGVLQGSALASGVAGQQHALLAGQSNIQQDQANQQKTLASLLSGIATPSARESSMTTADQSARAANLQTELAQYQSGVQQQQFAASLGEKAQADALGLANARLLAQINNTGANYRANLGAQTSHGNAVIGATAAGDRTAAQIKAANQRAKWANATRLTAADISAGGKVPGAKGYQVTYLLPATTAADPNTGKVKIVPAKRVSRDINSGVWDAFIASGGKGSRKLRILGVPEGTKVQSAVPRR